MILAVSRFRIANGMEAQVKAAFLNRPHLVDVVPAFLGMETFTDSADPTAFYLVTRWTDADSFQTWHNSKAHQQSHKFIPKGLKLDPGFTSLWVLDRLSDATKLPDFDDAVADSISTIARYLSSGCTVNYLVASLEGTVLACNETVAAQLGKRMDEVLGHQLWDFLTRTDAELLRRMVESGARHTGERFLLNFVDSQLHPFTLQCHFEARNDAFILIGAPPVQEEQALRDELIRVNNELTVLVREDARQRKALKRAHADLEEAYAQLRESHWHLRKIQEVLPICISCQKVKTGDGQWDELIEYIRGNADFLSHSYCPDCGMKALAQLDELKCRKAEEG